VRRWAVRHAAVLLAVGACQFVPGALRGDAAGEDSTVAPYCDPNDPALIACYQFEGNALDASNHDLDAATMNVSYVTGKVGMAMQVGATSAADVAENSALDPANITIEAWIKVPALPSAGSRMGILDNNGQYGFFLLEAGNLRCAGSNTLDQTSGSITVDVWHHVACVHNGNTSTLYADGVVVDTGSGGGNLATGGTTGISLAADNPPGAGDQLIGLIDELRILNVARTTTEICEDAGACP